jgi:prevent-host-death family protein
METVNIHYAKTHFSKLLLKVNSGEEIIISKAGKPYAKLVPLEQINQRTPGIAEGTITDAFFEPLPEEELIRWE